MVGGGRGRKRERNGTNMRHQARKRRRERERKRDINGREKGKERKSQNVFTGDTIMRERWLERERDKDRKKE